MPARLTVNVIIPDHGYGLLNSAGIIITVLEGAGIRARILKLDNGRKSRIRRMCYGSWFGGFLRRDVNIFLEQISPRFFNLARCQVLIPNQEFVREKDRPVLPELDRVICKSRHAEEIFSKLGCRTAFSSFTSGDRRLPAPGPKHREFLLLLGNRPVIAERVVALWARHPEWPALTVSGRQIPERGIPPNVRALRDYLPMEEIIRLQNAHLFHLCVTAAEGFGHKLNEGMSCGAIVIATDGPPMNELVRPERGFLVRWTHTSPKDLGIEYHFDENDLERTIQSCVGLAAEDIDRLAANARRWFEQNDLFFRQTLPEIVRNVGGQPFAAPLTISKGARS